MICASLHYKYVILLLLCPFFVNAQLIETNVKQSPRINYALLKRIDTLLNGYINKNYLTGAVTLVVKDNQLVQYKGYGYADADTKRPMKNNDIFRIMSQTKSNNQRGHNDAF